MKFYHGTSDILPIKNAIIPPIESGYIREEWRNKFNDKIFFTNSLISARKYAKKCCKKYGGNPIIYQIIPQGEFYNINNNEFIADSAIIIEKIK